VLRRRSLFTLCAAAVIIVAPVMGLCNPLAVSIRARGDNRQCAKTARDHLATSTAPALDPDALAALIKSANPDVVALQEWTSKFDSIFPSPAGWYALRDDELCVVSRYPIRRLRDVGVENWNKKETAGAAVCYEVAMPQGPVPLINLHLASPHRAFEAALQRSPEGPQKIAQNSVMRLKQSQAIGRFAKAQGPAILVAGDFNTPQESDLFARSWPQLTDAYGNRRFRLGLHLSRALDRCAHRSHPRRPRLALAAPARSVPTSAHRTGRLSQTLNGWARRRSNSP